MSPSFSAKFLVFDESLQQVLLGPILGGKYRGVPTAPVQAAEEFADEWFRAARVAINLREKTEIYYFGSKDAGLEQRQISLVLSLSRSHYEVPDSLRWANLDMLASENTVERSTLDDINLARDFLSHERDITLVRSLPDAIRKGSEVITQSVNRVGNMVGWDHNLDIRHRVGVIGTSLGILALSEQSVVNHLTLIIEASNSLLRKQHSSGGWGTHSIEEGGFPVVHSTAYAIWALCTLNRSQDRTAIKSAITWLNGARKRGGWGVDDGADTAMLTPTTLALVALSKTGLAPDLREEAIEWIMAAQHEDGGWGCFSSLDKRAGKPTPSHTARSIDALLRAGISQKDRHIVAGAQWLLNQFRPDRGWESSMDSEYIANRSQRLEFKHSGLSLCLIALLQTGTDFSNPRVLRGLSILLNNQNGLGGWEHELAPGHIPIWATFDAIVALSMAEAKAFELVTISAKSHHQHIGGVVNDFLRLLQQHEGASSPTIPPHAKVESIPSDVSPWKSGLFFLATMLLLLAAAALMVVYVNSPLLPVTLIFVLMAFLLVMISVFRQTDRIPSTALLELIKEVLRPIGLLVSKRDSDDSSKTKKSDE